MAGSNIRQQGVQADWSNFVPPRREEPTAQWLMTFTDLVALLICFFVLLFSMKELDIDAWNRIRGSLEGVFSLVTDDKSQAPQEAPVADEFVVKKGSVLPYLQQVLKQRLEEVPAWQGWEGRYERDRDELWYRWREEADPAALAPFLRTWKNEVQFVVGGNTDPAKAFAALDTLRDRGARVVQAVVVNPDMADGIWMVVKGIQ